MLTGRNKYAFAGALLFFFGVVFWKLYHLHDHWQHPYVPPRLNADGTVDYTLISKPLPNYGGIYWVIRLPQSAYAEPSQDGSGGSIINSSGQGITFDHHRNELIKMAFLLPEIEPVSADMFAKMLTETDQKDKYQKTISINANAEDYSTLTMKEINVIQRNCPMVGEVGPGVKAYIAAHTNFQPASDTQCPIDGTLHSKRDRQYIVSDENGEPLGSFFCGYPSDDVLQYAGCGGNIIVPFHRYILANFVTKYFPPENFREATQKLVDFFVHTRLDSGEIAKDQIYTLK